MSRMSDYDLALQEITSIMQDEPTPQDLREMALAHLSQQIQAMPVQDLLDIIQTGLDEVCARATMSEEVAEHEVQVGRIMTRIQLVASMLESRKPPRFRVVQ